MATLVGSFPGFCSTYQATYSSAGRESQLCPDLPPIKYHQPLALEVSKTHQLQPRYFPLIPPGPRRVLEKETAICQGIGTNVNTDRYLDKKPITRTLPPRQVLIKPPVLLKRRRSARGQRNVGGENKMKFENNLASVTKIPPHVLDALCNHVTWVSTTRVATEEAKLPMNPVVVPKTTFEENSDMVRSRPVKREPHAALWQKVALVWDRAQLRACTKPPCNSPELEDMHVSLTPKSSTTSTGSIMSRKNSRETISLEEKITGLIRNGRLNISHERPRPGYAGFIPRSPIDTPLEKRAPRRLMETEMKASYRTLPASEIRKQKYSHKGPLSRTVTLTRPYNPFNKVEEREL